MSREVIVNLDTGEVCSMPTIEIKKIGCVRDIIEFIESNKTALVPAPVVPDNSES